MPASVEWSNGMEAWAALAAGRVPASRPINGDFSQHCMQSMEGTGKSTGQLWDGAGQLHGHARCRIRTAGRPPRRSGPRSSHTCAGQGGSKSFCTLQCTGFHF